MLLIYKKRWLVMNNKGIFLLLFGITIILFPQYVRKYRAYEVGKKLTKDFIVIQRITGVLFVIIAIIILVLDIK
jgi:succinate dehydrogenase hydrophobic anchor subunit